MAAQKISIFFLLFLSFEGFSQKSILKQKIDYSAQSERLEDILLDIAEVGDFSFSYNPDLLPVDSLMTLNVENSAVKDVLKVLLGEEMELKFSGNHLVILRSMYSPGGSAATKQKSYTIDGYVTNSSTGYGVSRAVVFDVSKLNSTLSDSTGFFSLEVSSKEETVGIAIARKDFQDTAMVVLNGDQELEVSISPIPGNVEVTRTGGYDLGSISRVNNLKVVKFMTPETSISYAGNRDIYGYKFAQASFLPFLGTNLKMSGSTENKISINILAGYNGATNGVEIGGLLNINRHYAKGVQIAGIGNIVGTETVGFQMAGIFNTNLGNVNGVQFAGINNLVLDTLQGFQIAGINNIATHNVDGFQIAGISNIAVRDVNRMQIAGITNFGKNIGGAQVAGIFNTSYGTVNGLQVAGIFNTGRTIKAGQISAIMNVAIDTVSGVQLAALLNFARVNKGFQLGIVNINHSVPGTSIGLLNLVWKGYNKVELYANEVLYMSARVKLGTRKFYNIIGFGTQGFEKGNVWGYTYGFGGVIGLGKTKKNDLNIELTLTDLQNTDSWFEEINLNSRLNVHYARKISKRLTIFGGPSWSMLFYSEDQISNEPFLLDIPPYTLIDKNNNGTVIQGWIGFEVGVRLL